MRQTAWRNLPPRDVRRLLQYLSIHWWQVVAKSMDDLRENHRRLASVSDDHSGSCEKTNLLRLPRYGLTRPRSMDPASTRVLTRKIRLLNILMFLSLALVTACTTVHIHNSDGSISTSNGFGMLSVAIPSNQPELLIEARGFGLLSMGDSLTLGYAEQKMALLTDSCRVVFWIDNSQQVEAVTRLLGSLDGICTVGDGSINVHKEKQ